MTYKYIILLITLATNTGCSVINMFKGDPHYMRVYFATDLKESINDSIGFEYVKGSPKGYSGQDYSEENWNKSWNSRMHSLYDLVYREAAYRGPTGKEFIRYIIEERRRRGLPELIIEERNKDRVPKDLILPPLKERMEIRE